MYVTYSDLIQIGIFICALVGLCCANLSRENENSRHYCNNDGCLIKQLFNLFR